jgi:hypothetical protein
MKKKKRGLIKKMKLRRRKNAEWLLVCIKDWKQYVGWYPLKYNRNIYEFTTMWRSRGLEQTYWIDPSDPKKLAMYLSGVKL